MKRFPVWSLIVCILGAPLGAASRFWEISASVGPLGAKFDPLFEAGFGDATAGQGTYALEVRGGQGEVLFTRRFTPPELEGGPDPEARSDQITGFFQRIPVIAGASSIVLRDPAGQELGRIALGGAPPVVTITSPAKGFSGVGRQTVSWTIADSDSSHFWSNVQYSSDHGVTWGRIDNLEADTSAVVDFDRMPGSDGHSMIRIVVSDGVNTGMATSSAFSVPKKSPDAVGITSPEPNWIQPADTPIYLSGYGQDTDDGTLQGSALKWTSDLQGDLGEGNDISVRLRPGRHRITLRATDSDGNSIHTELNAFMAGGRPSLSVQFAPLSPLGVRVTLGVTKAAHGAELSEVRYSLDDGTSWTKVPPTTLPYTFDVRVGGLISVTADVTDASGQGDYREVLFEPPVSVAVTPVAATVRAGQTAQFTAQVVGGTTSEVVWAANLGPNAPEGAKPGKISQTGLYTAPSTIPSPYSVTITALSLSDGRKSASATILLTVQEGISSPDAPNLVGR